MCATYVTTGNLHLIFRAGEPLRRLVREKRVAPSASFFGGGSSRSWHGLHLVARRH